MSDFKNPNQAENELFMQAQEKFLESGDSRSWSLMWTIGLELCKKTINKILHKTNYKMCKADFYDKTLDACEYVLRRYKKKYKNGKKYKITKSPAAAFHFAAIHALYYENQLKLKNQILNPVPLDCV